MAAVIWNILAFCSALIVWPLPLIVSCLSITIPAVILSSKTGVNV
ncbi:hypothetical protein [uncultured Methanobrevibacter sp.]|nr:hypothetical protein [uncultured Methanobrevibacter sp.]